MVGIDNTTAMPTHSKEGDAPIPTTVEGERSLLSFPIPTNEIGTMCLAVTHKPGVGCTQLAQLGEINDTSCKHVYAFRC